LIAQRFTREQNHADQSRVSYSSRTLAGVPITQDTAVKIATVWACRRYLSQTVAVLPWHVMQKTKGGADQKDKHPVDYLIARRPNPEWSSFQFRETLVGWALLWGNGYAEIEVDGNDRPFALWPVHPERVQVCRNESGVLYYEINNGAGEKAEIDATRMFHIRGFGEGPVGVSVINYAAQSLGWAQAAQLFGASFFGNGATPSVVVKNKKTLTPDGLKLQKAEMAQLYKGPRNANRTAHVDSDTDIEVLSFDAQKTQLVESHLFLVEEICRWFGVPPHKVAHLLRATFSNIEHQAIEAVVDSVTPWVRRFEDEADYKLFGQNRPGLYTKMNMRALLRGDNTSRATFYQAMFAMGVYSPNDIRRLEDENELGADGDKHLVQLNLTTLEKAGEEPIEAPAPAANSPEDEAALDRLLRLEPVHA
jgi:HK97 family phage portal protein